MLRLTQILILKILFKSYVDEHCKVDKMISWQASQSSAFFWQ